jgi:hypothetical protein
LANSQQKEEHLRRNYEEIKEAFQKLQLEYNQKIALIGKSDIEDQNKMKRIVQLQQTVDLITQVSIRFESFTNAFVSFEICSFVSY